MADLNDLGEKIVAALPGAVTSHAVAVGDLTLNVEAGEIVRVARALRDTFEFKILIDICGADYPQREKRFDVVYHFLSITKNVRVRVKLQTDEATPVPTIVPLFP